MKALIGVSTVLFAGLNFAGHASQREEHGDPARHASPGIRLAQTGGATLPIARATGVSGGAVALNLSVPDDGVRFVKFPEFPADLKLSHGFRLRGYWIVSIGDLPQLQLLAPPGLTGTVRLNVQYFRDNETASVAQRILLIDLKAAEVTARAEPAAKATSPASRPDLEPARNPPPEANRFPPAQETETLERGIKLMRSGDIAAARLLFEDLAVGGSAKGARALAETYDPVYLKGLFIAGLRPNPETAKKWYRRAAELGDTESVKRLATRD